jgi:hypothetical protein
VGIGVGPVAVGGGAEPPGDRPGGVRGQLVGLGCALAQGAGVYVGADGVAAAGPAVVLDPLDKELILMQLGGRSVPRSTTPSAKN